MTPVKRGDDGFIREDPVEAYRMPLLEHLRELRKRLVYGLAALVVSCVICLTFADKIWAVLVAPMNHALHTLGRGTMATTNPIEGVMTMMRVGGLAGVGLASPILFYQMWKFIAPGLYPKEQRTVLPLVFGSTSLFLGGAAFCYFVIFQVAFPMFLSVMGPDVQAVLSVDAYLDVAATLLIAFGAAFQLPVVVYLLAKIGLINHRDMIKGFRYALVGNFVIAALITPPDVLDQALMAVPLTILYIISIGIAWLFTTKKPREAEVPPAA